MVQLEGIKVEDPPTPVAGIPSVALPRAASSLKPAELKRGGLVQVGQDIFVSLSSGLCNLSWLVCLWALIFILDNK